jgi:thiamine biosynthesis lipoprotein ApbE
MKRLTITLLMCACFLASCQKQEKAQAQSAKPTHQVLMLANETTTASLSENSTEVEQEKDRMLTEAAEKRLKEYEKANTSVSQLASAHGGQSR